MRTERTKHFTLIELLTVTAIVMVLTAILLPALRTARERAVAVQCLENLRAIGVGMMLYRSSEDGLLPAAVQGYGNYHTRATSRFDYAFGGEYCNGGLDTSGPFPFDTFRCAELGGGRIVSDANDYPSGTMPKNFGDSLVDGEYTGEANFHCSANQPTSDKGFQLTWVYDTSTSPWTLLPDQCLYSAKPKIFGYSYPVTLTNYSWDWSYKGEYPGQKGGTDGVDLRRRHGVCDPFRSGAIQHPQAGVFVIDNSGPNGSFIDRNFFRGRINHGDGVNMLFFDGHAASRRWDKKPYMFIPWATLNGLPSSSYQYCKSGGAWDIDADPLWRPWYDQFPLTSYSNLTNQ